MDATAPSVPLQTEPLKIFFAFTLYYLVERLLRYFVSRTFHPPGLQSALRSSRKDSVYFGILLGAFISLFSFPFCANALWQYQPLSSATKPDLRSSPLSLSADVCITSRGVLWVSELNRLDLYPSYVYHHIGSLVMLLSAFKLHALDLLYLPLTTLVTEVPGDFVWILAAHQEMDIRFNYTSLKRSKEILQVVNVWVYALIRIPSIPITIYSTVAFVQRNRDIWNSEASQALLTWVCLVLLLYSAWVFAYLKKQAHVLKRGYDKHDT